MGVGGSQRFQRFNSWFASPLSPLERTPPSLPRTAVPASLLLASLLLKTSFLNRRRFRQPHRTLCPEISPYSARAAPATDCNPPTLPRFRTRVQSAPACSPSWNQDRDRKS